MTLDKPPRQGQTVNIMKPVQKVNRLLTYPAVKKSLFIAVFNLSFYTALLRNASFPRISSPPPPYGF
jgi:hypothetical protein